MFSQYGLCWMFNFYDPTLCMIYDLNKSMFNEKNVKNAITYTGSPVNIEYLDI